MRSDLAPEPPFISIALATFNGERHLAAQLDSLMDQTLAPNEVIVCDDGSQDQTMTVLNQYSNRLPLRVYQQPRPVGVRANFRQAVSLCQGEIIAFCDQDDVWLPHKLSVSVATLRVIDGPQPALVFTDLKVVDQRLNQLAPSFWTHRRLWPRRETFESLLFGNFVTGCTTVFNRAMAEEIKRMPDNTLMHDFWLACVAYGIGRHRFIEQPTVLYRQHSDNVTQNGAITLRSRWHRLNQFLWKQEYAQAYLMPEIRQAEQFCEYYAAKLNPVFRQQLIKFIRLKYRSPFYRRWRAFLVKFLYIVE